MRSVNVPRVFIGGIVAGLVINVSEFILNMLVLGAGMDAMMARMNLPPLGGQAIVVFVVLGFALGVATAWLYAAIRPRFGAGWRTALLAGAAVWFFAYFYGSVSLAVMRMFPAGSMAVAVTWGLGEILIASVVAGALYKE
jgi:hypothetical protein